MSKYNDEISKIHFSDEGKINLMKNVKENANKNKVIKFSKLSKVSVIAASLALVSVTAFATGILPPVTEILSPIFGGSVGQTEIIEQIGRPIGASDTDKGVTITAEAIIGDKNNVCVVFKVAQEDGSPLELPDFVNYEDLVVSGTGVIFTQLGGTHGNSRFELGEDGHYRVIQYISSDDDMPFGENVTASFEDLGYWGDDNKIHTLVDGTWKMKFELNYEDTSITIDVGESFVKEDVAFTVNSLTISPVGLLVDYTFDKTPTLSTESGQSTDLQKEEYALYNELGIVLTMQDGTKLEFSSGGGGSVQDGYTLAHKSGTFDEIIPLEEIDSITVGDIVVFLD
ncbi:DUF4179 domain-containing protein [Bengtsoniella intestinalis]|uniref:DUF4179 domain-containing protein n=1 Tax=Bengtsoniella intestinalis TaxID=3073143 RepID=UPI00391EE8D1